MTDVRYSSSFAANRYSVLSSVSSLSANPSLRHQSARTVFLGGMRSNSSASSAPAERSDKSKSSSNTNEDSESKSNGGSGNWRNNHNRQGGGRGRGRGGGGGRGRGNNRYNNRDNNRERNGQNHRRFEQDGERNGNSSNDRHQHRRNDGNQRNSNYGRLGGRGRSDKRRRNNTPNEPSSSSPAAQSSSSSGDSANTDRLRERLNQFRASSSAMRQKQAEGAKGGAAESNPSRSGSSNAASTKATSKSPSSSSESDSNPATTTGTSKISELRNALMGSLKRNQAAARDTTNQWRSGRRGEGGGSGRYQQQYQQNQTDRRPSWRDRAQVREQLKGGIGGVNYAEESPQESASEKILREMEEAKQKAIQAVQEAGMVQAASSGDIEKEEDESNNIVLPNRSMSLLELSKILRVRTSKLIETVASLGERVPRDDADAAEYKIDIDVAELAALELGFDPVRAKHGAGHKWKSLEDAERRMRRGVSGSAVAENTTDDEDAATKTAEDMEYESLPPRPPVVCIMGHVDHGKTTLMDALRRRAEASATAGGKKKKGKGSSKKKKKAKNKSDTNTKKGKGGAIVGDVAGTEAGGITQVVTAFQLSLPSTEDSSDSDMDAAVTFLDTPGHAAFKSMRRSGSSGADIIVLVVAADDGVSPQTIEIIDTYKSIARAQPGSISLVVAMTKIDKPGVKIDESITMIENQLLEQGILTEGMPSEDGSEFGPPAQLVPVSGMTGEGLDDLIEGLVLQSEVMDLRADEEARAEGVVMDARVDKGLGIVADCIVRWGKLERGDYVVSGVHGGKVRILSDTNGAPLKKARPSQPVRIVGLKSLPKAGDPIVSVQSEEIAKELIERREALASTEGGSVAFRANSTSGPELQVTGMASKQGSMLQKVLDKYGMGEEDISETIRIPVVIKADADGSLEAVRDAMLAIGDDSRRDIVIDPISLGVGAPTTTDVTMAKESGASVFCFGLKGTSDKAAASLAEAEGVSIVSNDVIYTLLDEAKDLFAAHLPPVPVEKVHGSAEVKAVYDINNKKDAERIAGLQVSEGQLFLDKTASSGDGPSLTCHFRILRNGKLISEKSEMLRAKSLRRFKEEVTDVRRGDECGLGLGFEDIQEGDTIECYSVEMKSVFI